MESGVKFYTWMLVSTDVLSNAECTSVLQNVMLGMARKRVREDSIADPSLVSVSDIQIEQRIARGSRWDDDRKIPKGAERCCVSCRVHWPEV